MAGVLIYDDTPSTTPSAPRQPPQALPDSKPPGIRVVRGSSPLIYIDRVSMVWSPKGRDLIRDHISSIPSFGDLHMVTDSGASVHCCYPSLA